MTNNTIKPIDTTYNGYKFRSRNEARWAIFFDELHIAYEYEPQGFDLNGIRYLPDFHLSNGLVLHQFGPTQLDQIWVEIKPDPDLSEDERKKLAEFVKQTDHHILLIAGQPDINTTLRFIDHHPQTGWFVTNVRWLEMSDGQIGLVPIENLNNSELLTQTNTPRLRTALEKARQSRFEFGQTPTPPSQKEDQSMEITQGTGSKNKICQSCGKEYVPDKPYHIYCTSCYFKQKEKQEQIQQTADLKITADPKSIQPNEKTATKKKISSKLRSRPAGCLFYTLVFAFVIAVSAWFINSMATGGFLGSPLPTATATIPATYTPQAANAPVPKQTPMPTVIDPAACVCSSNTYDCADFATQTDAQACFVSCFATAADIHFLDSNEDGEACETLP